MKRLLPGAGPRVLGTALALVLPWGTLRAAKTVPRVDPLPRDPVEVGVEGPGPFTMDDAERITPVVLRSLRSRFPRGFQEARVTLRTERKGGPAWLDVHLERPRGYPDLLRLRASLRLGRWREVLDGASSRRLRMRLDSFRLVLSRERVERLFPPGADSTGVELTRISPLGSLGFPEALGTRSDGFREAGEAAGFPPRGEDRLGNPERSDLWVFSGPVGAPLGRLVAGVIEPAIGPGGQLGFRVRFGATTRRALRTREALALERRLGGAVETLWGELETQLQAEAYATAARVLRDGSLAVDGAGYLALDRERAWIQAAERRRSWKPTLLVNPGR